MLFHKKKKDYFDEKREADCSCCRLGSDFDGAVVCKAGLDLEPDGHLKVLALAAVEALGQLHCRKFSYDPLKRKPFAPPPLREYDPEDFKL